MGVALPTEHECHVCEDGMYVEEDYELYCDTCSHVPFGNDTREYKGVWERFWEYREERADKGDRVRAVGGFPEAYWGTGEYEYHPTAGFTLR